jgi:hypothetical protein
MERAYAPSRIQASALLGYRRRQRTARDPFPAAIHSEAHQSANRAALRGLSILLAPFPRSSHSGAVTCRSERPIGTRKHPSFRSGQLLPSSSNDLAGSDAACHTRRTPSRNRTFQKLRHGVAVALGHACGRRGRRRRWQRRNRDRVHFAG